MEHPYIGEIALFAAAVVPQGWAPCDGQVLPISQNEALFSLLGFAYGGDGRSTFALPDLRGRAPVHAGHGPGLPDVKVGQTGGRPSARARGGAPYNAGPYVGVRYMIALQGIFPPLPD